MLDKARQPLVSIVILNYNGLEYLEDCIRSVLATDYSRLEIIVADNGSTDGSLETAREIQKEQRQPFSIVSFRNNLGFAKANNLAASSASGEFIVFLNCDTIVDPGWLKPIIELFSSDSTIGIIQPLLLRMRDPYGRVENAGGTLDKYGFGRSVTFDSRNKKAYDVFYASGAAFAIRRDLWIQLGGFDESFVFFFEDIDLCWSCWEAGRRVVVAPEALVFHAGGGSRKKISTNKRLKLWLSYNSTRGRLLLLLKHYKPMEYARYLTPVLLLYLAGFVGFLLKGDFARAASILVGGLSTPFRFKSAMRNRTHSNKKPPFSTKPLIGDLFLGL